MNRVKGWPWTICRSMWLNSQTWIPLTGCWRTPMTTPSPWTPMSISHSRYLVTPKWRMDEYVPTIPIIRFKPHKVKSRNMMDKMLNRYFDKVVESEFNEQRMRSEQLSEGSFTKCGNRCGKKNECEKHRFFWVCSWGQEKEKCYDRKIHSNTSTIGE